MEENASGGDIGIKGKNFDRGASVSIQLYIATSTYLLKIVSMKFSQKLMNILKSIKTKDAIYFIISDIATSGISVMKNMITNSSNYLKLIIFLYKNDEKSCISYKRIGN